MIRRAQPAPRCPSPPPPARTCSAALRLDAAGPRGAPPLLPPPAPHSIRSRPAPPPALLPRLLPASRASPAAGTSRRVFPDGRAAEPRGKAAHTGAGWAALLESRRARPGLPGVLASRRTAAELHRAGGSERLDIFCQRSVIAFFFPSLLLFFFFFFWTPLGSCV